MPIKDKRGRVGGAGYTVFTWQNHVIAFARSMEVVSPEPVAAAVEIQPLNAFEPIEIITSGASRAGTLTLTLTEYYNEAVWQRLSTLFNTQNLVDIMRTMALDDSTDGVQIQKIVIPPMPSFPTHMETFYNCMITDVRDGETINIETMQIEKPLTIMFTHSRKLWINSGQLQNKPNRYNQQTSSTGSFVDGP